MESLWTKTTNLPEFPSFRGEGKTDVLIVGGGMAGLLCAWEMEKNGTDYMLLEADRICSGVTAGTTAKLTSQHGLHYHKIASRFGIEKAAVYYQANEEALERFRKLCQDGDCDFQQSDACVYSRSDLLGLEKELRVLQRIGVPANFVPNPDLPFETVGAVRVPNQGHFHPLKFAKKISAGLNICEHSRVTGFDGSAWHTDKGTIRAETVIVATHFPFLNKHGGYFLKQYQHRSYVLALQDAKKMDAMYVSDSMTRLSFRNYGDLLLLGGGSHRTGKQGGGWVELERFARNYYPEAKIRHCWATQDCITLDDMPYIGRYGRGTNRLFVATGFNKWGMTGSMVASHILADMVAGKKNPYEALYTPERTMLRPRLAANSVHALWNVLTPTGPRCPHMGCALKWNYQEHSWDCPCHGSRFSEEGKLLDNPATGDLQL